MGGAIAADVHGKNHHAAGSFAQPRALVRPAAAGRLGSAGSTPASDPGLFWATAGGMGLTGIILARGVQLTRVQTSRVRVDTVRTADIDETMAYLSATDDRYGYTVAWTDCLARGGQPGPVGDHQRRLRRAQRPGPEGPAGPAGVPARRAARRPAGASRTGC